MIKKTRIKFDFELETVQSFEKLKRIVCSTHWTSGLDVTFRDRHRLFVQFVHKEIIVIDECEYEPFAIDVENEKSRAIKLMLGKRSSHPVLCDMALLFSDEPFENANNYRNTIYFPRLFAYARADGMKAEDIIETLNSVECSKIIIFPYEPLDNKSAYYELTLSIEKSEFAEHMKQFSEEQLKKQIEATEALRCYL